MQHLTHELLLWILLYADDAVIITRTAEQLQAAVLATDLAFSQWGLVISVPKTKVMVIGPATADAAELDIRCQGQTLEAVDNFKYLGSMMASDASLDAEVANRLKQAGHAFHSLQTAKFWRDPRIAVPLKLKVYVTVVLSILLYASRMESLQPMSAQALRYKKRKAPSSLQLNSKRSQSELGKSQTLDLGDGAKVIYQPEGFSQEECGALFDQLQADVKWEQREITVMGRKVMQPRLVAYMAEHEQLVMTYSRTTLIPTPYTPAVLAIKAKLEELSGESFNSCLLNLYRSGKDHVSWHSDNEVLYGPNPTVASASFGAERHFLMRQNADHTKKHSFLLGPGDLLVMKGTTQQHWMHSVPKRARVEGERISLTFRKVVAPECGVPLEELLTTSKAAASEG
ncbi:hypothetical protein WJX72_006734 [[Myrmecia] bisecta]|uniref:Fe2OG dioxygenase domain-containing protein n=1 Tax=[Myrmecia] bisecta TaxID=41462 RepID=A0AAW1QFD7_9CHLO